MDCVIPMANPMADIGNQSQHSFHLILNYCINQLAVEELFPLLSLVLVCLKGRDCVFFAIIS